MRGPLLAAPEVVVVLGAGSLPDGRPHPAQVRRADRAAELALARPDAAVIASGGRTGGPESEAAHMARAIRARGVAAERVLEEDEALDTIGNALCTAARYLDGLAARPLLLVTSPFHARRAERLFRHVLPGWPIEVVLAEAAPDDEERAIAESTYLADNERVLAGTAPGDLRAIAARLVARFPDYATAPSLAGLR